jgi:hypothetical protein
MFNIFINILENIDSNLRFISNFKILKDNKFIFQLYNDLIKQDKKLPQAIFSFTIR